MKSKILILFLILFLISFIDSAEAPTSNKCDDAVRLADAGAEKNIPGYSKVPKSDFKPITDKSILADKFKKDALDPLLKNYPDLIDKKVIVNVRKDIDGNYIIGMHIYDKSGKPITNVWQRILRIDENGDLIVKNANLGIQTEFQNKGIATEIYKLEDNLYKKMGVKKVYIDAEKDGRYMWSKKEFNFKFRNSEFVNKQFNLWLKSVNAKTFLNSEKGKIYLKTLKDQKKTIYNLGDNPYLYPKEFLIDDTFSIN